MKTLALSSSLLAALLSVSAPAQVGAAVYHLAPIVSPDGRGFNVFGINNKGEVVGMDGNFHAFVWRDGVFRDLHGIFGPDAVQSLATDINERSQILASSTDAQGLVTSHLIRGERIIDVNVLGVAGARLEAINNRGQGAGTVAVDGVDRAFLWHRGKVTLLDSIPQDSRSPFVMDINNRGTVVGFAGPGANIHGLLWTRRDVMELSGLGVGEVDLSQPLDINDRGQVLVFVRFSNRQTTVVWERGEYFELPSLFPDQFGYIASSINNSGNIVGASFPPSGGAVGTLWRRGAAVDLNTLIAADDPLKPFVMLQNGELINDRGDIVASGFDTRTPGRLLEYMLMRSN
jgi:probable HAF family extracellular repeat protein